MPEFNAEAFANWLNDAYRESKYKSFSELADDVKLSRTTVNGYAKARPQTVSDKPSRPKRENVIQLATKLNKDVNEALLLAGFAPLSSDSESHEVSNGVSVIFEDNYFSEDDKNEIVESFRLILGGIIMNRMSEGERKALNSFRFSSEMGKEKTAPEIERGKDIEN